jgi:hypothetical protein
MRGFRRVAIKQFHEELRTGEKAFKPFKIDGYTKE